MKTMNQDDKAKFLAQIESQASRNEIDYWGCSQAVLDALQKHFQIGGIETFMAATAFAGGVAGNREACGALIGGIMAIGLMYGRKQYEPGKVGVEQADLVECSNRAREYCDRFKEKCGGLRCQEVRAKMGFSTEATQKLTPQVFKDHAKCGYVTGIAARLAAEVMLEPGEKYLPQVQASLLAMAELRKQMEMEKA